MYLYEVTIFDDSDQCNIYVAANNEKEAEDKVYTMNCWSCLITIIAKKIDIVDGYRVKLEKVEDEESYEIFKYINTYDYRNKDINLIIIKAKDRNPSGYQKEIFDKYDITDKDFVILDLRNVYGAGISNVWEWCKIGEPIRYIDIDFKKHDKKIKECIDDYLWWNK